MSIAGHGVFRCIGRGVSCSDADDDDEQGDRLSGFNVDIVVDLLFGFVDDGVLDVDANLSLRSCCVLSA